MSDPKSESARDRSAAPPGSLPRKLFRLHVAGRLVMAFNTLLVLAILGWILWKIGRLIGSW